MRMLYNAQGRILMPPRLAGVLQEIAPLAKHSWDLQRVKGIVLLSIEQRMHEPSHQMI